MVAINKVAVVLAACLSSVVAAEGKEGEVQAGDAKGGKALGKEGEGKEGGKKTEKKKGKHWTLQHKANLAEKGCELLIGTEATWSLKKSNKPFCDVKDQAAFGSMVHCLKALPHKEAIPAFIKMCKDTNHLKVTEKQIDAAYDNATNYLVYNPLKTIDGWNKSEPQYLPIGFSDKMYKHAYVLAVGRYYNLNYLMWFGIMMLSYWFGVLFIAGICNLAYFLFPKQIAKMNLKVVRVFRRYVSMPACFSEHHANDLHRGLRWISWIVPTRLEALLVLGYVAITIAGNSAYMKHVPNSVVMPDKTKDLAKMTANRLGITVMWIIPQLILFAGRNNFMQWVSGWLYSRQIYIHKWIARVALILVLVHTIAYTVVGGGFSGKKYLQWYGTGWMIWGTVSLAAMLIACVHSLYFLRRNIYEFFLITHILMAVFFIVGGWIHCKAQGYGEYYYAATAIWVFDRVVRLARLFSFGIKKAEVQLMAEQTLRVTVERPVWWKPVNGAHAFVHFMRPTMFFMSHPFTIVEDANNNGANTITFYMKVKGGVTLGLHKYLSTCPGHKAMIPICVEGPYGQRLPLDRFNTSVFVSGGHGVPGPYSQARAIAQKGTGTAVHFYWLIRHYQLVEWFYPELQKLNEMGVKTVIFVTQPEDRISPITSGTELLVSDEKKLDSEYHVDNIANLKARLSNIEFREGRPILQDVVSQEIAEAPGSIAFTTCGGGNMVDAIRKSIANDLMTADKRVDLFEQAQIW